MAGSQYYASGSLPANCEILKCEKGKKAHLQNFLAIRYLGERVSVIIIVKSYLNE